MNKPKPAYTMNGHSVQTETFIELMLDNLQSERDVMIPRLRYVERVLLTHGRISKPSLRSREEIRE